LLSIRQYEKRDLEPLLAMMNEIIAGGEAFVYESRMSPQEFTAYIASYRVGFVAELSGRIVGGYVLRANQPGRGSHAANAAYLVSVDARGHGVGKQLGEHSIAEARRLGFTAIQFNAVVSTNAAAVKLWKKLGFESIGVVPGGFRRADGHFVDLLIMHRFI
jgi:L-amino acid N-acyltransferase YncA